MRPNTRDRRHVLIAATVVSLAALIVVVVVAVMAANRPEPREAVAGKITTAEPSWPVPTPGPVEAEPGEGTFTDPALVDRTDPDAVALAVAELSASHDTVTDRTETAAVLRAGDLMDPDLVASIREPDRGAPWVLAAEHEAYSVPVVRPAAIPPQLEHEHEGEAVEFQGEEIRPYMFDVTYGWQGRDGWVSDPTDVQVRSVMLSLAERDGQWVVVEHYYGEPLTSEYAAR